MDGTQLIVHDPETVSDHTQLTLRGTHKWVKTVHNVCGLVCTLALTIANNHVSLSAVADHFELIDVDHTSGNYACMYMSFNIKWHINTWIFFIRHINTTFFYKWHINTTIKRSDIHMFYKWQYMSLNIKKTYIHIAYCIYMSHNFQCTFICYLTHMWTRMSIMQLWAFICYLTHMWTFTCPLCNFECPN